MAFKMFEVLQRYSVYWKPNEAIEIELAQMGFGPAYQLDFAVNREYLKGQNRIVSKETIRAVLQMDLLGRGGQSM